MANPKATWPVVRFVLTAMGEGWTKKDARGLLDEIPPERYTELLLRARHWNQEMESKALAELTTVIGKDSLSTIVDIVQSSKTPAHLLDKQRRESKKKTTRK